MVPPIDSLTLSRSHQTVGVSIGVSVGNRKRKETNEQNQTVHVKQSISNKIRASETRVSEIRESETRVREIRVREVRVSEIRVSEVRGSEIRVSEIRVSKVPESETRVSDIRASDRATESSERAGAASGTGEEGEHVFDSVSTGWQEICLVV